MIITAASADRQSFGCGRIHLTRLISAKALFGDALRQTHSFESAFKRANSLIEEWEREKGYTASRRSSIVGSAMRGKLPELEQRLDRMHTTHK